jgi:hypothetical protein
MSVTEYRTGNDATVRGERAARKWPQTVRSDLLGSSDGAIRRLLRLVRVKPRISGSWRSQ